MDSLAHSKSSMTRPLLEYLKKQRENQKLVKSVEITATFSLITFFLFFAIKPTVVTISTLVGDIQAKKILTKGLGAKIDDLIMAQDSFSTVQERYQIVESSLPDRTNIYNIYQQVTQTGTANGISLDKFGLNLEEDKNTIDSQAKQVSIGFNVKNNYANAIKFVDDLLNNRRLINITSLNFGVDDSGDVVAPVASSTPRQSLLNSRFVATFYYWDVSKNEQK